MEATNPAQASRAVIGCHALALIIGLLILTACGDAERAVDARYSTDQGLLQAAYAQGETEHVVRDDIGAYICVLRRPDDLAALRARYAANGG